MFKNKFALITGAGGLLGIQHAEALAEIGFNVVLLDEFRTSKLCSKCNCNLENYNNLHRVLVCRGI